MAHIKRIDLTRDVEAHADAYREAIEKVCRETAFSGGKYADAFDKEFAAYVGSKYASGVNNGTSALHLAMLALGVGPGDEVIVPANTYIATAWGVSYTGATPVFADCTPDTWEIDPSVLETKITERTKGIIGVHLYGQPFDYAGVREIADRHGLFVVEDCAQAHGAQFEGKNVPRGPVPRGHSLRGKMWEPWEIWHASASIRAKTSMLSEKAEVSPVRRKSTISISTA